MFFFVFKKKYPPRGGGGGGGGWVCLWAQKVRKDDFWQIIMLSYSGCFVKLLFLRNSVPFHSVLNFGIGSSAEIGMPRNEHFLPRNNGNRSECIPRNFFGTKCRSNPICIIYPLYAVPYGARMHPTHLRCTQLNYTAPSELRFTLTELPPFIEFFECRTVHIWSVRY